MSNVKNGLKGKKKEKKKEEEEKNILKCNTTKLLKKLG